MPIPVDGNWPPGVTAVQLTPEEAAAKLNRAAASQSQVQNPAPNITVTPVSVPLVPTMATQDQQAPRPAPANIPIPDKAPMTEVTGEAALVVARKFGLDHVWLSTTKESIPVARAIEICRQNPELIYFDFDRGLEVVDDVGSINSPEEETAAEPEPVALIPLPAVSQHATLPVSTVADQSHAQERVVRSWGGILSSPGQTVYVNPAGVVRIEMQGRVMLQKGLSGDTRIVRVMKLQPSSPKTTTGQSRQPKQVPDRQPVPQPLPVDLLVDTLDTEDF